MKFNSSKTAFGRHETFAMRYGWLPKGFHALQADPDILRKDDNATVVLGVGKNMVKAIRYWLRAAQMIDQSDKPLALGQYILDNQSGVDPYLEDEATIWLVHWLIASNSALATAWFWFFNCFQRVEFTAEEMTTALNDFVHEHVKLKIAQSTIKSDAALILRMYSEPNVDARNHYDDMLDAPLSLLHLISKVTNKLYHSYSKARLGLPDNILAFALAQIIRSNKSASVPIEDLMYSDGKQAAPGTVFRLSENEFIATLERLCIKYPNLIELRDTAGISQLYLLNQEEFEPLIFLEDYYGQKQDVAA